MLNFLRKSRSGKAAVAALAAVAVLSLAGCGQEKAAAPQATLVRSRLHRLCAGSAGNGAESTGKRADYRQIF